MKMSQGDLTHVFIDNFLKWDTLKQHFSMIILMFLALMSQYVLFLIVLQMHFILRIVVHMQTMRYELYLNIRLYRMQLRC